MSKKNPAAVKEPALRVGVRRRSGWWSEQRVPAEAERKDERRSGAHLSSG